MTALDNFANKVSKPRKPRVCFSEVMRVQNRLRNGAGVLLGGRVGRCGRNSLTGSVSVHVADKKVSFGGLETCSSVWACPVCSSKIEAERREEVFKAVKGQIENGGEVYMAVFTIPHTKFDNVKYLRERLAAIWKRLIASRQWQGWKTQLCIAGVIRKLEVTHGGNGWHPHLHVLFFINEAEAASIIDFQRWLFRSWSNSVKKAGLGECSKNAFDFELAGNANAAADYVAKGAAFEMVATRTKKNGAGRSPWALLQSYVDDYDQHDGELFLEYANAFKGARQLTWSRYLKDRFGIREKTDEEILEAVEAEKTRRNSLLCFVDGRLFSEIAKSGQTYRLAKSALENKANGVYDFVYNFERERTRKKNPVKRVFLLESNYVP